MARTRLCRGGRRGRCHVCLCNFPQVACPVRRCPLLPARTGTDRGRVCGGWPDSFFPAGKPVDRYGDCAGRRHDRPVACAFGRRHVSLRPRREFLLLRLATVRQLVGILQRWRQLPVFLARLRHSRRHLREGRIVHRRETVGRPFCEYAEPRDRHDADFRAAKCGRGCGDAQHGVQYHLRRDNPHERRRRPRVRPGPRGRTRKDVRQGDASLCRFREQRRVHRRGTDTETRKARRLPTASPQTLDPSDGDGQGVRQGLARIRRCREIG